MPAKKPGRRKPQSHRRLYSALALVVLVGASIGTYAYLNIGRGTNTSVTTTGTGITGCPTPPSTNSDEYACIETTLGNFEVELYRFYTPHTVSNFVNLARSGFFNGLAWWRVEHNFVIQTGDPNVNSTRSEPRENWGSGTSGVSIPFEYSPSLHNTIGSLAMASTAPQVGGSSQFFINLSDNSQSLDNGYAVFGRVIFGGMTVVNNLGSVNVESQPGNTAIHEPVTPDYITSVVMLSS